MKKILCFALSFAMVLVMAGCSNGVSQEEYDKVVSERDALLAQIESIENRENNVGATSIPKNDTDVPIGKFDEAKVLSQLDVKELSYSNDFWNYAFLTIKNNSEHNISITANVKFFDDAGNLVGAKSADEEAVESGFDTMLYFMPDEKFANIEYELAVSEEERYGCVLSDLSYEDTVAKDKVILSVTNIGTEPAEFVQASVLFFNEEALVGFSQNYIMDDESELKAGKTISKEMDCYETFDSYKVFFSGRR